MRSTVHRQRAMRLALVVAAALLLAPRAHAGGDWNDAQVEWKSYDDGLAAAKKQGKPICMIFLPMVDNAAVRFWVVVDLPIPPFP